MSQYYYLIFLLPLFLIFIIIINYILLKEMYYYLNFDKWQTTDGLIIESKITKDVEHGISVDITYEYVVNSVKYKSKKINLGNLLWFNFKTNKINKYIIKYSINKQVKVYYHPKKHKISCLERTTIIPTIFSLSISFVFLIAIIILIYKLVIFLNFF